MKTLSIERRAAKLFAVALTTFALLGVNASAQTGIYYPPGTVLNPGPITQAEINAIADSTVKANAQARYDNAHTYTTQLDGVERPTDVNTNGRPRLFYSPQKLTAADCLVGRHWEMVGGYAGCVCDGDATRTRVSNDDAAACVIPPPPPPPPPPPSPPTGSGNVLSGFTFGGLGSQTGVATAVSSAITGNWTMIANNGSTIDMAYSGNIGALTGIFSGVCTFNVIDFGGGNFGLVGPCGSGTAYSWGVVSVAIAGTNYTGTFDGTWGAWGASGSITATLNSGVQMYIISRGGSDIGFVMMNTSTGAFNGYDQGNSINGYINGQGIGAITLGNGTYYAAMTGSGIFGTINLNGPQYAIGGTASNFFMVDSGGSIFGTGSLTGVATNDPGWTTYFNNYGLPAPVGFNALLSVSFGNGLFYACTPLWNGEHCYGSAGAHYDITSP